MDESPPTNPAAATPSGANPAAGNSPSTNQGDDTLRNFIERIERLEEDKAAILTDIREVYSAAKASGFDPKIMRQIVKMRAMDSTELSERDELLKIYREAVGLL